MDIGASFSHRHIKNLGLDPLVAIKEFKSIGLKWIRLGCYWNEIEEKEGRFSFTKVEEILKFCEKNKIKVLLTIGMKAPRFPEYYLPHWISRNINLGKFSKIKIDNEVLLKAVLKYLTKTVNHYKKFSCIKVWQVENEPLDPAGPNWQRIDSSFLEKEIETVKFLDPNRKILINLWGNELSVRKVYKKACKLTDIIGLDIYLKHPIPFLKWLNKFIGPLDSKEKIKNVFKEIKSKGKKIWITELQVEPWEPNELITQKENPQSFLVDDFEKNFSYGKSLNPDVILLWGFEYWYWRKNLGDLRYWDEAKRLIQNKI